MTAHISREWGSYADNRNACVMHYRPYEVELWMRLLVYCIYLVRLFYYKGGEQWSWPSALEAMVLQ